MAQFIQELDRIDFKNTASDMIAVGDIVPVGKMHGVAITDIAPTICKILQIPYPNASMGNAIKLKTKK